jgi:hypothetical protein
MSNLVIDRTVLSHRPVTFARASSSLEPLTTFGVVGNGELSAAIAERLVTAGFPVTLHGANVELLNQALARLDARLNVRVRQREIARAERERQSELVSPTCWYIAMSSVDVVIVCDDESEGTSPEVLAELDRVMKRGAIIAMTATSSGDVKLVEIEREGCTSEHAVEMLASLTHAFDYTFAAVAPRCASR